MGNKAFSKQKDVMIGRIYTKEQNKAGERKRV
jgi:hypothetical protein